MSVALIENEYQRTSMPLWASPFEDVALGKWTGGERTSADDWSQVVDEARSLVEAHPKSSAMRARLAQAELAHGDSERAFEAATQAFELATPSDSAAVTAALRVARALGKWNEIDSGHLEAQVAQSLTGVLFAARAGDLGAAARWLGDKEDESSSAVRGWLELKRGNTRAAVRNLRRASHSAAPRASALVNLGYMHALSGSWRKAIRITAEALSLEPKNKAAALNMAGFLVTLGDTDGAVMVLREATRGFFDPDVEKSLIQLRFQTDGDHRKADGALSALSTRLRLSGRRDADVLSVEGLRVAIEHHVGKASSSDAGHRLLDLLEKHDYASLETAIAYSAYLNDQGEASGLEALIARLAAKGRSERELLGLRARLELLRFEFEAALKLSKDWDDAEPFNYGPTSLVTYLQCVFEGNYSGAVEYGTRRLRRQPMNEMLANNVAYAYASLGRVAAARRILPEVREDPTRRATLGLIRIKEDDQVRGAEEYEAAGALARGLGRPELAEAIAVRRSISLLEAGAEGERADVEGFLGSEPTNVYLRLLQYEAERVLVD